MTGWPTPAGLGDDLSILHGFRRNTARIRRALAADEDRTGPLRVDAGFLEQGDRLAAYQRLSGPIRRALRTQDRVAFARAFEALRHTREVPSERLAALDEGWQALQAELDATVVLDGQTVRRRQVLSDWLDAVTFHNAREFRDSYGGFLERWGRAAEEMAAALSARAAEVVLALDAEAATVLDEPLVLPPPPPAPPLPEDRSWWERLRRRFGRRP